MLIILTKLIRVNVILLIWSMYFAIFESYLSYSSLIWAQNFGSIKHHIILQKMPLKYLIINQETAAQVPYF